LGHGGGRVMSGGRRLNSLMKHGEFIKRKSQVGRQLPGAKEEKKG